MPVIQNFERLNAKLATMVAARQKGVNGKVVVGYEAAYALAVHETPKGTPHPPASDAQRKAMFAAIREREERGVKSWDQGQPKYLEQPARELNNKGVFGQIVTQAVKAGKTLLQGLLLCGLRLQRESQLLVPVDTGNLKGSAFTRVETK